MQIVTLQVSDYSTLKIKALKSSILNETLPVDIPNILYDAVRTSNFETKI
jgi:hypothetical protein